MINRLSALGVTMRLSAAQVPNGPRVAKLQLFFSGADGNAITLAKTLKGKSITERSFEMPDGSIP
ncbi:hypothetical protein ACPXA8_28190, partial [Klebsiella pneumoniae]|uniref:hypothetical protein n=1 Tax=Klebsiella pneumoniae TaxID=573 RepID=UPI003CED78CA